MTRPLSKRSLKYLNLIAQYPEGYGFHIPWSTELLLLRADLIQLKGWGVYGRHAYVITPAGQSVLKKGGDQ